MIYLPINGHVTYNYPWVLSIWWWRSHKPNASNNISQSFVTSLKMHPLSYYIFCFPRMKEWTKSVAEVHSLEWLELSLTLALWWMNALWWTIDKWSLLLLMFTMNIINIPSAFPTSTPQNMNWLLVKIWTLFHTSPIQLRKVISVYTCPLILLFLASFPSS